MVVMVFPFITHRDALITRLTREMRLRLRVRLLVTAPWSFLPSCMRHPRDRGRRRNHCCHLTCATVPAGRVTPIHWCSQFPGTEVGRSQDCTRTQEYFCSKTVQGPLAKCLFQEITQAEEIVLNSF